MNVSFVIPIYNHFSLINQLLCDIRDYTTPNEVIVVDDCSNDKKTLDGLAFWEHNFNIAVLRPNENLGFLKASNYGVSKATGDIVCLISSDVRIEDNLAQIVKNLLFVDQKQLIGGVLYEYSTGWNNFKNRVCPYLEGWLLCCLKSAWDELGGFDERFAPHDMEDVDLSTTAISKGYFLDELNNSKIRHIGAQTIGYTEERMELTKRNREKFREKWGLEYE